ncbi:MAG: LytR C-terminal domain-containing protein [Acidimicrobiales bacterium]
MKFPRFSWRKPAPRPAFIWRWLYPVVLVGFIVTAALLADAGLENALSIKDGKITQVETDPCKPSFLAEVDPTPTMLIIETDASNDAIGLTAMSLGTDKKGGWVLQLPLETRLKDGKFLWQVWREAVNPTPAATPGSTTTTRPPATQATTTVGPLSADSATAGKTAMVRAVGKLLGFSFATDVMVLPTKALAALIAPALPFNLTLQTPVQTVSLDGKSQKTDFQTGVNKVQNETDVVKLFEAVGPNASARLKRQGDLWSGWISALRASPTALAAFKPESPALVNYVNALVTGPSEFRLLPIDNDISYLGLLIVDPDVAQTVTLAAQMVPFPLMIEPGARLRTALFNGTADCNLTLSAATRFVENGAQIDVLGNASTLDIAQSEVIYYNADLKMKATDFAKSLGIDSVRLIDGESAVDITVTLGADFKA